MVILGGLLYFHLSVNCGFYVWCGVSFMHYSLRNGYSWWFALFPFIGQLWFLCMVYYKGCCVNLTEMVELSAPLGRYYYTCDIPNEYACSYDMWFKESEIEFLDEEIFNEETSEDYGETLEDQDEFYYDEDVF